MIRGRDEQPCLAQAPGEFRRRILADSSDQPEKSASMIGDEQLAAMIDSKGGDLQLGIGQDLLPGYVRTIVARCPNRARRIVAVNISTREFGEEVAVINDS